MQQLQLDMPCLAVCPAGYIDVEADEIKPGYAVLLMYIMLVGTCTLQLACMTQPQQQQQWLPY
jgi:formate hydrogenlyase subunit 6/NADH:ubiquinone oxidoreductase subunit I